MVKDSFLALDKRIWDEARTLYEAGLSTTAIAKKLNVSRGGLQRLIKKEGWVQGIHKEYVDKRIEIGLDLKELEKSKKALPLEKKAVLDKLVEIEINDRELVNRVTKKALKKADEILTKGSLRKAIKVSNGVAVGESVEFIDEELSAKDLKDIVELADKASITLNINPRFAPQLQQLIGGGEIKIIAPFKDDK